MINLVYIALSVIFAMVITYMVWYNLHMKKKERAALGRRPVNTQEGVAAVKESEMKEERKR